MFDVQTRTGFTRRILQLTPDARRRWGIMASHQMVCHLCDQLHIALGEISTSPIRGPLRYPIVKQLVIDVLPWPKGRVKGPPEAFITQPTMWETDVATLCGLLETFASRRSERAWALHPIFGRMSGSLWSRLTCRHFDHHLTQFDC